MKTKRMILINYYENANKSGIYCIRNQINKKLYIGSTKNSFAIRKNKHLYLLRKSVHYNEHLQNAWNYYKEKNFSFEILFICSPQECERYEGEFIKLYSSNKREFGYNVANVSSYRFDYNMSNDHNNEKSIRKKEKAIKMNGLITNEKGISKSFKIYDINGKFIEKYNSEIEFIEKNGGSKSHISITLNKRQLFYKNNIILFSGDILSNDDINYAKNKTIKKVELFNLNNNYINTFDSAKDCANFLNCKTAEIRMCCLGKRSRIKKYITKYKIYE
jgi:group I intron endonuclease